jgi:hypothetical protein
MIPLCFPPAILPEQRKFYRICPKRTVLSSLSTSTSSSDLHYAMNTWMILNWTVFIPLSGCVLPWQQQKKVLLSATFARG